MSPISNADITLVRGDVRLKALSDFAYFVGTVLGVHVPTMLCADVQKAVMDQRELEVETKRPNTLGSTLRAWLEAHGIRVLSPFTATHNELLTWLDLEPRDDGYVVCTLEADGSRLRLTWL